MLHRLPQRSETMELQALNRLCSFGMTGLLPNGMALRGSGESLEATLAQEPTLHPTA